MLLGAYGDAMPMWTVPVVLPLAAIWWFRLYQAKRRQEAGEAAPARPIDAAARKRRLVLMAPVCVVLIAVIGAQTIKDAREAGSWGIVVVLALVAVLAVSLGGAWRARQRPAQRP